MNMHYLMNSVFVVSMIYCVSTKAVESNLYHRLQTFENRLSKLENKWDHFSRFYSRFDTMREKRSVEVPKVSFSAALNHKQSSIGIGQNIVYNKVLHNDGNAYNQFNGIFTVPYDGVYMFTNFVGELNDNEIYLRLMVNGQNEVDSVAEGIAHGHNDQGGNVAILKLSAGMTVWIEAYNISNSNIDAAADFLYNSFSGALLYTS